MGYALASVGVERGHQVRLVSGPGSLPVPAGVEAIRVTTALDMLQAVRSNVDWCRSLVMAAAVADWRPRDVSSHKLKKGNMPAVLALERNPDILGEIRSLKGGRVYVGFAAETEHLLSEARRKLTAKGLDMSVANDVTRADSGFETETNKVTLLMSDGTVESLPTLGKSTLASRILEWVEDKIRLQN